ncbi:MAG TPA: hypothetical protein VF114_03115, partial [Candidatus Limnocylindria bacterium]
MVVLLGIYLLTTTGLLSFAGANGVANASDFGVLGAQVLGSAAADKLILLVVFLASEASVQATILFTVRPAFGMAPRQHRCEHPDRRIRPSDADLLARR